MPWFTDAPADELLAAIPALSALPASACVASARVLVVGASVGGLAAAASLRAAGFTNITIVERNSSDQQQGAGIVMDDAAMAVLKGLECGEMPVIQPMRWTEERTVFRECLCLQTYPGFSTRYNEVRQALLTCIPHHTIRYCTTVTKVCTVSEQGTVLVEFEGHVRETYDLLIGADGPRSTVRKHAFPDSPLRFAGYAAWRGVVERADLPAELVEDLLLDFPLLGNCVYFIQSERPRQHAILYDIGGGCFNWIVYENRDSPVAGPNKTTCQCTPKQTSALRETACMQWGSALGGLIARTDVPFCTDVYDILDPLPELAAHGRVVLVGDAAGAVSPHMARGANKAIHDGFTLGRAAVDARSVADMTHRYSATRAPEAARSVLFSRHLGQIRNGILASRLGAFPRTPQQFEELLRSVSVPGGTSALPNDPIFNPIWEFEDRVAPADFRGYMLDTVKLRPSDLNHVSLCTDDVSKLAHFYEHVLGFARLSRPDFGFGGVWFVLPGGLQLHLIEAEDIEGRPVTIDCERLPEGHIKRNRHFAFTVEDIAAARRTLEAHGVHFSESAVPGTPIVQLFFYDPDGNGLEVGNFGSVRGDRAVDQGRTTASNDGGRLVCERWCTGWRLHATAALAAFALVAVVSKLR